nr:30S ribosomal protein S9, chloroplastic-like [Malus domestica]
MCVKLVKGNHVKKHEQRSTVTQHAVLVLLVREKLRVPLITLGYESGYDVFVKAHGGGLSGQVQAISLGIARALLRVSEGHRRPFRKEALLTRDTRVVERKKPMLNCFHLEM